MKIYNQNQIEKKGLSINEEESICWICKKKKQKLDVLFLVAARKIDKHALIYLTLSYHLRRHDLLF